MTFGGVFSLILVTLKLLGKIQIGWLICFLPSIIEIVAVTLFIIIYAILQYKRYKDIWR